ncbi:sulfatase family protein [Zhongshania sp. BJYM1]|uniref:sulfatase family protein n=1 Tax=Zhongshania aquatica TaxID=2965069 RepID=UPI0022B30AD4|nr:sulfatase-like hydrolase/transferase [Marortus sp. BJYM1]
MSRGIKRRTFLEFAAAATGAFYFKNSFASAKDSRPNIIYILADDMGFADLGCYGSKSIQTPNIDKLSKEGLKLSQAYANSSVCSPSRLALITGRYPGRLAAGLDEPIALNHIGLSPSHPTLPSLLNNAGYRTTLVGKWHLGELPEYSPLKSGYEHFYGIHAGGTDYFNHRLTLLGKELGQLYRNDKPSQEIGYLTTLLEQYASNELDEAVQDSRPFLMSLHFTAPHWPWEGPEDHAIAKTISNPQHFDGGNLKTYAAMVESMDQSIGRLLEKLKQLNLSDNTIVIFSSDNGGERFSDTWPLIGMKGELLEGGIRVPLLVRWPSQIAAHSESDQVISLMDLMPTLLHAASVSPDSNYPSDGENLLNVILGKEPIKPRTLFWRHNANNQLAMRDGDWKYLTIGGNEFLFNLGEDERERANLSKRFPARFQNMKKQAEHWANSMLPYTKKNYSQSIDGSNYADHY